MRIPRIYHPEALDVGSEFALNDDAANHIGRVLRMAPGQHLELFDGTNLTFSAEIIQAAPTAASHRCTCTWGRSCHAVKRWSSPSRKR